MKIKFSADALDDLDDVFVYGAQSFGAAQSKKYLKYIDDNIRSISAYTQIGRLETKLNPAVRRFEVGSHVIFYEVKEDHILVIRVLHQSRDFLSILSD